MILKRININIPAVFIFLLWTVLFILSEQNHAFFSKFNLNQGLLFGIWVILGAWLASMLRKLLPRVVDLLFAGLITYYLYRIWPHMFFDDAGFIMRYLDQVNKGFWFHYNAGEGPVFGISGFLHGLYCSVLVKLTGMSAERALHLSNLTGLFASVWFLAAIFRNLLGKPNLGYAATVIVVLFSKTFGDVLFTGMEMPLHVALILGSVYYFLAGKIDRFYLFSALSIISKLDAVPVIGILMLIHLLHKLKQTPNLPALIKLEYKKLAAYFVLPLGVWVLFAYEYFGSPFPQSAKAKMLYHSGANDSWFPFLEGFSNDIYKLPMLFLLLVFLGIHIYYAVKDNLAYLSKYFIFGWMYLGIMILYYFYNPNERMLWYYSLPDLLLVAQCTLSSVWLAAKAKDWQAYFFPAFTILVWIIYLKPDTDGGRNWMFSYLENLERERYEVGKYIAGEAGAADTLIAWHGLLARPFPGFVIDGTGLNSKVAVEYKLNRDSLIGAFNPRFGIHHANPEILFSFSKAGYKIKGLFADVTLENWPAWVWWEKSASVAMPGSVQLVPGDYLSKGKITREGNPMKTEGKEIYFDIPVKPDSTCTFWGAFESRMPQTAVIQVVLSIGDSIVGKSEIEIPPYGAKNYPSLFTFGKGIPVFSPRDSIHSSVIRLGFLPGQGADTLIKINNPMLEYRKFAP